MSEMVFDSAAKKMLTECMGMAKTRGSEYQDTWNLENQISIFTDETLNRVYKNDYTEADAPAASRLLRLAALVDTKISRIASGGRHKRDNYVDLINYLAVLGELREEYENRLKVTATNVAIECGHLGPLGFGPCTTKAGHPGWHHGRNGKSWPRYERVSIANCP